MGNDMPTFDIVSETNEVELRNAVDNALREVDTRFDFRGVEASIELKELTVTLRSQSDFQVRQLEDLFRNHCTKRNVSTFGVEIEEKPVHSGKFYSLTMAFKQGIDQPKAKEIVKFLKDSKLKVQASIQGDKVRISGKKRDDLQDAIALLKKCDIELPMQYENFRD
jgi:cyclic-di-GMP-binding protein